MNPKTIIILFTALALSACIAEKEEIKGHAFVVDNFNDKNPLQGIYIEVLYTNNEGYSYDYLASDTTDKYGYFEIDTKFKTDLVGIDSWAVANVYSDPECADSLGFFHFQFADDTYSYKTIFLDTFSLSHNIWIIPRIGDLGDYQPDEISIDFYNCELTDTSQSIMTFFGSMDANQTFTPVEVKMTLNMQHWLSYGTRELARGSLKKDAQEIGFGYFTLDESIHTTEGDTLFLNFILAGIQGQENAGK